MHLLKASLITLLLIVTSMLSAQNSQGWELGTGSDLCIYDSLPFSLSMLEEGFVTSSEVIFCPTGIKRSSPNDVRKRYPFDWEVKYNNIYLKNSEGIVYEGMNEHGFSATLMFLENCQLPEKERELIPVGASLAVNFFIDHFKCVDTALLAIWDIRIFDDLGLDGGWPFRIVLHDTCGATAYVEYVEGKRSVYTPSYPSFIVGGPDYSRLISLEHIPEELPRNRVEHLYLEIVYSGWPPNTTLILLNLYMNNFADKRYYGFFRYHQNRELFILTPNNDEAVFNFREIDFSSGTEVSTTFF